MHDVSHRIAAFLVVVAAACGAGSARAQVIRDFTPRFSTNDEGDVLIIGNTLMTCPASNACTAARNGTRNNPGDNDNNVFNMVNFSNPGTTLNAPATFGKIRSAKNMRQIQLGGRVSF